MPETAWRDAFVDALAFIALPLVAITELLSSANALTRAGVLIAWGIVVVALCGWFLRKRRWPHVIALARVPSVTREEKVYLAFFSFISAVALYLALASPPNFSDAITYHMPRVLRWIQDRSVAFYPTHNLRQLWIGPGWEYFQVQLELIAGTDRVANLLQWISHIATTAVVSLIARELGAGRRGQMLAALFSFTLPMAVVQASGSQVELFASFWMVVSLALLLRIRRQPIEQTGIATAVLFGAAVGIATLSKATTAVFLAPFIVWIAIGLIRQRPLRLIGLSSIALIVALAMNSGQMMRNKAVFGDYLGGRSAGYLANDTFGPRTLVSNVVRNAAMQLNTPSDRVNAVMTRAVTKALARGGMYVADPRTTWNLTTFEVPPEWDDEGLSTNQLHFLLIIAAVIWLTIRKRESHVTKYLWCLAGSALLFCFYLKWQPYLLRLHLPMFVMAGPAVGAALESVLSARKLKWVAVVLALTALHPAFRNNLRPIATRQPLFTVSYEERFFPRNRSLWQVYSAAADVVASLKCSRIGLIETIGSAEYPVWKIIERRNGIRPEIRHVGVSNVSIRAESERDRTFRPCAVIMNEITTMGVKDDPGKPTYGGILLVPPGFREIWKHGFMTVYVPGASSK